MEERESEKDGCRMEDDGIKLTKALEMYIKTIYQIEMEKGSASVTDITKEMGVTAPSVTDALQRLDTLDMIKYEKYRSVNLTPDGKEKAVELVCRFDSLKEFLLLMGIDEETAHADACEIEHIVHPITIDRLTKFVDFVKSTPESPKWFGKFQSFLKKKRRARK